MDLFLGGTCNNSTWRDEVKPFLTARGFDCFDPVVGDWTPDCVAIENEKKETSDVVLIVITKEMAGVYSIAEAVDCAHKRPDNTYFYVVSDGFDDGQLRSLVNTAELISKTGAKVAIQSDMSYLKTGKFIE